MRRRTSTVTRDTTNATRCITQMPSQPYVTSLISASGGFRRSFDTEPHHQVAAKLTNKGA